MTGTSWWGRSGRGPQSESCRLLSVDAESRVFSRLRGTIAWETLRSMLSGARLRLALVVLLSAVFWGSLYALFYEGFSFLESIHAEVISLLFNAFFSSLMIMLVFSTAILLYGNMYCSTEAKLLLTLPARAENIFAHKFHEAMWFSSWGFILLGSPMLVAYGVVRGSPWTYYLLLLPFMVSFVVIPATLGAICCMAAVAWLGSLRMHALAILGVVVCAGAAWLGWSMFGSSPAGGGTTEWFEQVLSRLSIAEQKFLPSWWLSSGLLDAAQNSTRPETRFASLLESVKFLAVLVSNGMLLQLLARWLARSCYRQGFSQLVGEMPARRQRRIAWTDEFLSAAGTARGRPLRLLLVKDLRLFRRDIAQWSQFVIFFGLLGLYFFNLRVFNYNVAYASMISFLNLAVAGLILSTFTTRFVYPMISLEGRRFWILGLLPVHRDQILWSKFLFSFFGGLLPCCALLYLSDSMLGISHSLIWVHEICCVVLCMGLSGIAVGLGARMPDLRESSPAKIAAGFGGTLCLVLSSLFIMAVVVIAATPTHLAMATRAFGGGGPPPTGILGWASGPQGTAASLLLVGFLGVIATFLPLELGLRAFRRLEP
jgi:ABC-2 type transport system permease protein